MKKWFLFFISLTALALSSLVSTFPTFSDNYLHTLFLKEL